MSEKGKLFVVSAPSGAGKTTLCQQLPESLPNIVRCISMTTRMIRPGEREGEDYFFVTKSEFKNRLKHDDFLEYAIVFGNYYGTPRKFVKKNLSKCNDVLLNIDVQGAMKVRKKFRKNSVFIYILPPSMEDLKKRLIKRKTDSGAQIKKRLEIARKELSYLKHYDYRIINDDIKEAFRKLLSIVIAQRCKLKG